MKYILASKSPRRKELMNKISSSFSIEIESIDEKKYLTNDPVESVKNISYQKGAKVASKNFDNVVISADTIVVLDGTIYGKPVNADDAINMLSILSGRTHQVITGYSIFYQGKSITETVTTNVTFYNLSKQLIIDYVNSKSPLDKAGAYGVQDNNKYQIIKEISGSYENVVGFPTDEIQNAINRLIS